MCDTALEVLQARFATRDWGFEAVRWCMLRVVQEQQGSTEGHGLQAQEGGHAPGMMLKRLAPPFSCDPCSWRAWPAGACLVVVLPSMGRPAAGGVGGRRLRVKVVASGERGLHT